MIFSRRVRARNLKNRLPLSSGPRTRRGKCLKRAIGGGPRLPEIRLERLPSSASGDGAERNISPISLSCRVIILTQRYNKAIFCICQLMPQNTFYVGLGAARLRQNRARPTRHSFITYGEGRPAAGDVYGLKSSVDNPSSALRRVAVQRPGPFKNDSAPVFLCRFRIKLFHQDALSPRTPLYLPAPESSCF